jgi:Fur family transcriptional regulator, peroxide stress response regulator
MMTAGDNDMTKTNLTPQRKAVLDTILEANNHPTAADIIERLRRDGQKISYATVYNSLRYLTEAELIRELKIGESVTRYDARMEEHHHIVCERCGRVDELLTALPGKYLAAVASDTNYEVHEIDLVIKGLCPECREHSPQ